MNKKKTIPVTRAPEAPPSPFGGGQQHTIVHQRQVTHSTIFDPAVLERYSKLVPDAPERVLQVFEQNSAVEREIAREGFRAARADNLRRDWMGFLIIVGGMATSALLAYLDKAWLSGGALVAIIAYAVIGYLNKQRAPAPPKP